jgi:hypothetical protein
MAAAGKLRWRSEISRTMANPGRSHVGSRITEAPSGVAAFRFRTTYAPQRIGPMTMIAISLLCGLLICLFRLDLDDAASEG